MVAGRRGTAARDPAVVTGPLLAEHRASRVGRHHVTGQRDQVRVRVGRGVLGLGDQVVVGAGGVAEILVDDDVAVVAVGVTVNGLARIVAVDVSQAVA